MSLVYPISVVLMLVIGGFFYLINSPPWLTMIIGLGTFIASLVILGDRYKDESKR